MYPNRNQENVRFQPGNSGKGIRRFSVRNANLSSMTGVFKGACNIELQKTDNKYLCKSDFWGFKSIFY